MATKTQNGTIEDARAKLSQVMGEIATIDTDLGNVANDLGKALAGMRLGDKKSEARAGELSLKRAELTRRRHDADLTRTALEETIARMEAEEAANASAATVATWDQVNADARELEARFAEVIMTAGEIARQLHDAGKEWQQLRKAVGQMGGDVGAHRAPANPAGLIRPNVIEDPAREVTLWKRQYIDPSIPVPPRNLSAFDQERQRAREIDAATKARHKAEKDAEDGGPFMIFRKGA